MAGATQSTYSDAQGRFAFLNIPSGSGHLFVDGNTANTLGTNSIPTNSFPFLQYTIAVVPNAENSLPTPVLLPRLNTNNAQWYYGTNDLVVTCQGIDGLKMTIRANSMRHPNGELVTPQRPALVSLNQVHHDNIPMPMPDGASPPFAWTLQPGGATFDPPVNVEYPNMSGLAPGAAAFFLTFNHDTERFEIVASGHVIEDGSKIMCDPGAGLTISGWGCNCPPYSVTGTCNNFDVQFTVSAFVATPHPAQLTVTDLGQEVQIAAPGITISADVLVSGQNQASCAQWEIAFLQNVLSDFIRVEYQQNCQTITLIQFPMLDALNAAIPFLNRLPVTGCNLTVSPPGFADAPSSQPISWNANGGFLGLSRQDSFVTWLVARNTVSGEVRYLRHVPWSVYQGVNFDPIAKTWRIAPASGVVIGADRPGKGNYQPVSTGPIPNDPNSRISAPCP